MVDFSNCPSTAKCRFKNGYGEITFLRAYEFDKITIGGGDGGIILLDATTTYATFPVQEFVYVATPYNNGSFEVRLAGPEPFYITRNGAAYLKGSTWSFLDANSTTIITGGSTILVSYHSLPFNPTGGAGGLVPLPIPKSVAQILLQGTNLVLQFPVTILLLGLFALLATIAHVTRKKRARILMIGGFLIIGVNWVLANQLALVQRIFPQLPSFQVPFVYKETPLIFSIYGFSATTIGFLGLIGFVTLMAVTGAAGLAVRR